MSKFQVGDIVKVVQGPNTGFSAPIADLPGNSYSGYVFSDEDDTRLPNKQDNVFTEEALELITAKENKVMARRTFKLLKDTPDCKKGAIFQEECEDGTQPYVLITSDNSLDTGIYKYNTRSLVEDAPNWFVEVFKVEPEYMTREELDRYHAFIKGKTATPKNPKVSIAKNINLGKVSKSVKTTNTHNSEYWTPAKRRAQSRRVKAIWAVKRARGEI